MPRRVEARYWDSPAFLGWLKNEPDRWATCDQIFRQADTGKLLLVTSALTLAEVLHLRGQPRIGVAEREAVEGMFQRSAIHVRGVERRTAELAREVVWSHGIDPKDAIHVATALQAPGVEVFETYDASLIKKGTITIAGHKPLTIREPWSGELTLPYSEEDADG